VPTAPAQADDGHDRTLTELEKSLDSPHAAAENLDTARDEVNRALAGGAVADEPIQGLSAQPLGGALHDAATPTAPAPAQDTPPQATDSNSPPPVPPPIPFQFGNSPPSQ
jgi:hypothetical protein